MEVLRQIDVKMRPDCSEFIVCELIYAFLKQRCASWLTQCIVRPIIEQTAAR